MKETPGPFACASLEMDFRDESALVELLERYLDGRATRFPATVKRRSSPGGGLAAWPSAAPLFVGADGDRITRGTLQYPVVRAFRRAGIDADRARHGTAGRVDGFVGHAVGGGDGARVDQLVHRRPESLLGIAAAR
jgi:hypothetical protein